MKSKDTQLLEEAYQAINESVTENFIKKITKMHGRDESIMVRYLAGLLMKLESEVPGVKEYIKNVK